MRRTIEVLALEFDEGGNTLWVHGRKGTVLRVKTTGKIYVKDCGERTSGSHADVVTKDDVTMCMGSDEIDITDVRESP